MSTLAISNGSISFTSDAPMTLEDISNLATTGQIAGVPAGSIITFLSFRYGMSAGAEIQINWVAPQATS